METSSTDRIEKTITLRAPRARVWRAFADAREFASWFGLADIEGDVAPGAQLRARVTHPGYERMTWRATIERVEPERALSWRWHPGHPDPDHDYDSEPSTLVEVSFADTEGGTVLTLVESGFDALPPGRREQAFHGNTRGWEGQAKAIARHVGG